MFEKYFFESGKPETWPMITKDTTIEELQFIHKKIWDYVIENGLKPMVPYVARCVGCEYARQISHGSFCNCFYCPIDWKKVSDFDTCTMDNNAGIFDQFMAFSRRADVVSERQIAEKIRDCPFKTFKSFS